MAGIGKQGLAFIPQPLVEHQLGTNGDARLQFRGGPGHIELQGLGLPVFPAGQIRAEGLSGNLYRLQGSHQTTRIERVDGTGGLRVQLGQNLVQRLGACGVEALFPAGAHRGVGGGKV